MSASRIYHASNGAFIRDPAVSAVSVSVDTSKWSKRKKNVIADAIRSGVAACGWASAALVSDLMRSAGDEIATVTKWRNHIDAQFVKPEKLEELVAYTAAWVRLKLASDTNDRRYYGPDWTQHAFLKDLEANGPIQQIPLDNRLTHTELRDFIAEYLVEPGERETAARNALIASIERGETISITYS